MVVIIIINASSDWSKFRYFDFISPFSKSLVKEFDRKVELKDKNNRTKITSAAVPKISVRIRYLC